MSESRSNVYGIFASLTDEVLHVDICPPHFNVEGLIRDLAEPSVANGYLPFAVAEFDDRTALRFERIGAETDAFSDPRALLRAIAYVMKLDGLDVDPSHDPTTRVVLQGYSNSNVRPFERWLSEILPQTDRS